MELWLTFGVPALALVLPGGGSADARFIAAGVEKRYPLTDDDYSGLSTRKAAAKGDG